ncbi:uncharacterized protein LOC108666652 [Hyalella azteca]|uniref:Uncharacterized protein LOC108666652 n=1 Tax=Hyalella azteca TaxID=294128 RepID=A0A8B7N6Z7_HYAAZ|nr:uncharacterized protein LOC108666652 [Hyalella azteca]
MIFADQDDQLSASGGSGAGLVKRWWRVGCSLHVEEALHCHDLGRLTPRAIHHLNQNSLPQFSFPVLYLEEDRCEDSFDPYGNVRLYLEFHKLLAYYGAHLKLYLIDEFVENTKAISRLLVTKRSPAGLPLSLKKIDFNNMTGHLFHNQVTIINPDGEREVLDHHLHIIAESTDDVNRWLFLHCIRKTVNHQTRTPNSKSLSRRASTSDVTFQNDATPRDLNVPNGIRSLSRRSSLSHSISPTYRDTPYDGTSCYLAHAERKSCPSPFDAERTRTYLGKVRKDFFRQTDLDFVL